MHIRLHKPASRRRESLVSPTVGFVNTPARTGSVAAARLTTIALLITKADRGEAATVIQHKRAEHDRRHAHAIY